MDLSTIIGLLVSLGFIVWGMVSSGNILNFWDPPSLAIVLGGSVGAIIASFPFSILKDVPKHILLVIRGKKFDNKGVIEQLVEMATLARRNGLLSLEQKANEIDDPFFKSALMLVVDAHEPSDVRARLEMELDNLMERHELGIGIYEKGAAVAPAFGMVGTLIGLINMLKGLDLSSGASDSLGANMAVAMVTTLYGTVFANVFFSNTAKKLSIRNSEEFLYKSIIIEGSLSILQGDNPKFVSEKLLAFLKEKSRGEDGGGKKGKKGDA